jgi:hypothetical protein
MSADNRNPPEAPEAVAFELLRMIEEAEDKAGRDRKNLPTAARLLDLYAECLAAVIGNRHRGANMALH